MEKIHQAVILAGGQGTRLRPLTDTLPKPMVPFHGRPFLEYLIEMLVEQGFEKVLLLTGYLGEVIKTHFGDGADFGIAITYSELPVEADTGTRVREARPLLDPQFVLMYCDNYWPMPFAAMQARFADFDAPAMVTAYENGDGYTRDNLIVDEDGYVITYDKSRTSPGLKGVDIGFIFLRREVLDLLAEGNVSFEASLYPQLVARRELLAFSTEHRYYSVGSHERLTLTDEFLARAPTVILDRDGVLNARMPKAEYVTSWEDWDWLPGAQEALALFSKAGYRIIVVTNQAGIARGLMTEAGLIDIHVHMQQEAGADIAAIYHCPHGWDEDCACRKPKPGMLFQAQRDFHLDLSRVTFIGDDDRDRQAASAAGCQFAMVEGEISLLHIAETITRL